MHSDPGHAAKSSSSFSTVAHWPGSRRLACLFIFACCRVTGVSQKGLPSLSACYTVTRVTQLGLPLHFAQWSLPMLGLPFPFPFVQWSGSRIWGCLSLACVQITRIKQLDLPLRYITDKDCCCTHFHVVLIVYVWRGSPPYATALQLFHSNSMLQWSRKQSLSSDGLAFRQLLVNQLVYVLVTCKLQQYWNQISKSSKKFSINSISPTPRPLAHLPEEIIKLYKLILHTRLIFFSCAEVV